MTIIVNTILVILGIGAVILLFLRISGSKRPCPSCRAMMPKDATKCPRCKKNVPIAY